MAKSQGKIKRTVQQKQVVQWHCDTFRFLSIDDCLSFFKLFRFISARLFFLQHLVKVYEKHRCSTALLENFSDRSVNLSLQMHLLRKTSPWPQYVLFVIGSCGMQRSNCHNQIEQLWNWFQLSWLVNLSVEFCIILKTNLAYCAMLRSHSTVKTV